MKKDDSFHISCKFQMLIKRAWFQYRNPNVQRFYTFILSHSMVLLLFSHSFLLLVLIPSKASSRPSSLGRAEVCPSRYPHFWRIPLFRFGWNLVLPFLKVLRCYSFFPVLVPRGPFAVMRGRFALLVFFFFSCLLSTDLSQSSFLFVLDGFWGSLLIYIFVVVSFGMLFSFSGLQDPLGLPPMGHPCLLFFGLSLDFSFGLDLLFHFFWA